MGNILTYLNVWLQALDNSSSWFKISWMHRLTYSFDNDASKSVEIRNTSYFSKRNTSFCFHISLCQQYVNVFLRRPALGFVRGSWFSPAKNPFVQTSQILWCLYCRLALSRQHVYYGTLFSRSWLWMLWQVMKRSGCKVVDTISSFWWQWTFIMMFLL